MTELKERDQIERQYKWDLSTLFENDEAWNKALTKLDALISEAASFQGKLNNADSLLAYFKVSDELDKALNNIFTYAMLRHSEDTRATDAQGMYSKAYGKYVEAVSATSFAQPEILGNDEEVLKGFITDPSLKDFAFLLENLVRNKAHTLSATEEKLLSAFGEVFSAPGRTSEALMDADMVFDAVKDSEGNDHAVNGSSYILLQGSDDRELRKNSFQSLYKGYKQHINTFASTYSTTVKAASIDAKVRHYESSRQAAMFSDNIPVSVYDNLVETVHKHLPTMYRYVKLRKKMLGLDELHYYDVYAPLLKGSAKDYSYEEAKEMVLEAVKPLGTEYTDVVKAGLENRWVDVYPNKGKRGGAYSSGTYTSNPYILCNYTGTLDSVSTLAHEMGHSMHSYRTNHTQPVHYANYTMFVAEVASTVNENLLIEQLLQKETDPAQRMALLNQYMEGFKGTIYRQTMFAEFEKEAHAASERGESLTPEFLNQLYLNLVKKYFGEDLVIDDEVQYEWARIPHFYRPFYVYVYATGYSTAVALSEGILHGGQDRVQKYLEFLSMGSSAYPIDELKHAGVDLTTPEPIDIALDKFAKILDDAEETFAKLKQK